MSFTVPMTKERADGGELSRRWIIGIYAVIGPTLGGLFVAIAAQVTFGLALFSWERFLQWIAMAVVFAFPYGGFAAVSAGVAHALLAPRLKPWMLVPVVALVGMIVQVAYALTIGHSNTVFSLEQLLGMASPPVASAVPITSYLVWRGRRRQRVA